MGAVMATPLLNLLGVTDWRARGFCVGVASHGIGTARAFQVNETAGAFAGIGMGLNALLTALLAPLICFGNKDMMRAAMQLGMVAILRMKRNRTMYRVPHGNGYTLLDANELYRRAVRKHWVQVADLPWKAVEMLVEIDLSTAKGKHAKPSYQPVKLLFVRGINDKQDRTASRKDWALFLSTDASISSTKMLQVYALRWSIEVYFKEAKQHLGFLQEQTRTFVSHIASIHLCAIRYLMLVDAKLLSTESSVGQRRSQIQDQFDSLNYAARWWSVFRSLIAGTLKTRRKQLNCTVNDIMEKLDDRVSRFMIQALQLDAFTMQLEHE